MKVLAARTQKIRDLPINNIAHLIDKEWLLKFVDHRNQQVEGGEEAEEVVAVAEVL
jgi:hypothetical protein